MNEYLLNRPERSLRKLETGNDVYIKSFKNPANIGPGRRMETSKNGQRPYAAVLTCADSRVPPEHIFSAGIGDLFVVRTAGNVVANFEIGSIEYAVQHLYVPLVVVMGHTHCGAVSAAMEGHASGFIEDIIREIQRGIRGAKNETEAIYRNILHSKEQLLRSGIIDGFIKAGKVKIICAEYDIKTGQVKFFRN